MHRHRHEIQRRVGELKRRQAKGVQDAPKRIGDVVSQDGNQEAAVFSLDLGCG